MRWTRQLQAQFFARRMRLSRTAKSCGSGAPTLALSSWVRSTNDGGKRARSPGRARISRNTIVQGMPAVAVYPWLLTPVLFFCTGGHGCNAHPAFPAPSFDFEGGLFSIARTFRAARTWTLVFLRRHAPRMRDIQYAAASRLKHNRLLNT